jgi:uncharacterized FlgJ-related protein
LEEALDMSSDRLLNECDLNAVKCDNNIQSVVETVVMKGVSDKRSCVEKNKEFIFCLLINYTQWNESNKISYVLL